MCLCLCVAEKIYGKSIIHFRFNAIDIWEAFFYAAFVGYLDNQLLNQMKATNRKILVCVYV